MLCNAIESRKAPTRLLSFWVTYSMLPRENEGTEREAQGIGRDMSCPRKLFLDERKSVFRDVRIQTCLALRFLVKRENGGARRRLMNIYIHSNIRPRLACMRTSRKTDFRSSKNNFRGHDISQGLDREPPSLSPHFLLMLPVTRFSKVPKTFRARKHA